MKLTRLAATAGLLAVMGTSSLAVAAPALAYPTGTLATASINATVFNRGGTATVNVFDATPGGVLTEFFESTPVQIATGPVVGANGRGVISGNIPAGATLGAHKIVVTSTAGENFSFDITVVSANGGTGGSPTVGNSGGGGGNGGGLANTGAAVTGIGILGGVLVAGGVFFVVAGRRRAVNQTPSV